MYGYIGGMPSISRVVAFAEDGVINVSAMSVTILVTVSSASRDAFCHSSSGLNLVLTTCESWLRTCSWSVNNALCEIKISLD